MDAEVSHKTLMAVIYCLLERTKQVSKNSEVFFVLYYYIHVFDTNGQIFKLRGSRRKFMISLPMDLRVYFLGGGGVLLWH